MQNRKPFIRVEHRCITVAHPLLSYVTSHQKPNADVLAHAAMMLAILELQAVAVLLVGSVLLLQACNQLCTARVQQPRKGSTAALSVTAAISA
eukprot:2728-Heterococcus_DN1.PRE.5